MKNQNHNHTISSSTDLKHRIMELNSQKEEQEEEIKRDFKQLGYSLTVGNIIKETISGTATHIDEDHDLKHDVVQRTVNLGIAYVIGKMFGRTKSIRGYLTSMAAEQIAEYIVKNNTDKIIEGVSSLVKTMTKNNSAEPKATQE